MSIRDDLKAYLDGELTAVRAAEVRDAIAQDEALRAEVEEMQRISKSIKNAAKDVPVTGAENVIGGMRSHRRFKWRPALAGIAGVAALVLAAGIIGPRLMPLSQSEAEVATTASPTMKSMDLSQTDSPGRFREEAKAETNADESFESKMPADPSNGAQAASSIDRRSTTIPDNVMDPNRLVIRSGSLGVRVKDVRQAVNDTTQLVAALGGYVESSNFMSMGGEPQATMSIRIPSKKFEAALTSVRSYGELTSETLSGEDVTAQVADINARIRVLRQEEEQYRVLMKSARRIDEILDIKQRIVNVRQEIESLTAQQKTLGSLAAMSQLQLTFTGGDSVAGNAPDGWFSETTADASDALKSIGKVIIQGLTYLVILSPVWLPIVGIVWWLRRRA